MKLKKVWKNYFRSEVLKEINSPVNGLIRVVTVFNKPRLMIGGMIQSGGMVRKIWEKAILKIVKEEVEVSKALVIGLGCGDCAFEVQDNFPKAEIYGVEVDKHVVDSAKCFFDLTKVKKLKIAVDDGVRFVDKAVKLKKKFDLIAVDVYLGHKMPIKFKTKSFYKKLERLLTDKGLVIFNHLFFKEHKKQAQEMVDGLDKVFKVIKLQRTASNLLIFGYK
jgi:spermidine synthase